MTVIDANCWKEFVDSKLSDSENGCSKVFHRAEKIGKILLDEGERIKQQYVDMKKPYSEEVFNLWFEEKILSNIVKLVDISGKNTLYKELIELGVPKGEHVYFRVAVHGGAKFVVSMDTDFFHPKKKVSGEAEKRKVLLAANGPVCKHLKKVHGVKVLCPEGFLAEEAA